MTRTPNRGEKRPLHPVLEKVNVVNSEHAAQDLSDYFYNNPRSAEIIAWIADNVGAVLAPEGLRLRWWGEEPFNDGENEPLAVFNQPGRSWMDGREREWVEFRDHLVERYPDVWEILDMSI